MRVDERGETAQDWLVAGDDRDGEDRSAILQRRAIFVASAIVGLAATACGDPQPCLKVSEPHPQPSASASTEEPPDAGVPVATDAGAPEAADAGDADAPPGPCLKIAPPQPCLEMAPVPTSSSSAPPRPPPRPCLNMRPPPQPCLDMPPPAPPKDPNKP